MAEVCYKVIGMIMRVSPIGVFCLLVPVVVNNGPKVLLPLLSVIVAAAIGSIAHYDSGVHTDCILHWQD